MAFSLLSPITVRRQVHVQLRRALRHVSLVLLTLLLSCSYSFKGSLPDHLKVVVIPQVANETSEFGIEQDLTDLLRDRTMEEGLLRLGSEEWADCRLQITLLQISDAPHDYDESETLRSIRTTLRIQADFEDLVEGRLLWSKKFNEGGDYESEGGLRETAIEEAVDKLILAIHEQMLADW